MTGAPLRLILTGPPYLLLHSPLAKPPIWPPSSALPTLYRNYWYGPIFSTSLMFAWQSLGMPCVTVLFTLPNLLASINRLPQLTQQKPILVSNYAPWQAHFSLQLHSPLVPGHLLVPLLAQPPCAGLPRVMEKEVQIWPPELTL